MSHDENMLDFSKLQRELDAAVALDAKYWRENDAKIRAVTEQKVATYDEFKDLVAASHLKPLDKGLSLDNIGMHTKQPWNSAATPSKPQAQTQTHASASRTQDQEGQSEMKVPNSGQEFARDWQRQYKTTEERYRYLLNVGAGHLRHIFKTEVSFGLLGDILAALHFFRAEDATMVLDILDSLQASSRFNLSLQFLSKSEKAVCEQLFVRLSQTLQLPDLSQLQDRLGTLQSRYMST